ncbi:MAG: MBOAT family O-acyltransferase [Clostridia bacterium]
MTYTAPLFLFIFLPLVMLFYKLMPQKHRWKILLIASYIFFALVSGKLIVFLLLSTFSIHHFGLWLSNFNNECDTEIVGVERAERKIIKQKYQKKKLKVLVLAVVIHIGILLVLKYSNFIGNNLNALLGKLSFAYTLPAFKFALPIGISFYTLQAISYMVDVYRGTIKADKNLGRLALFLGFFPQIMEGPICRYSQTAEKLFEGAPITYKNMTYGMQRIIYGLFKKMVVADRLNVLIVNVFDKYPEYSGAVVFVGMICYTCQLYMDFSGTMDIVIGCGEIFGVSLPENFRQPFFSRNVSEFWTRWHISLGAFFKDYIFYPLSLSKPLKKMTSKGRKLFGNHFGPLLAGSCALFVVWFCNGLWHGSAWNYIFFGMYYFFLIVLSNFTAPLSNKILAFLHINKHNPIYIGWQILRTVILVNIGELFFRANGFQAGFVMFKKMFTNFNVADFTNGFLLKLGMDKKDFIVVIAAVILVFVISIFHEKNIHLRDEIAKRNIFIRFTIYYIAILLVIIFGAYGGTYTPVPMMYAGF